ncbi:MAG: co-chaperone GroES [Veillonellaceae bacterium]|nr:co-chaperone GroES [Veillonellaceae bacterium]
MLKPLADRVLIKVVEAEEKTKGGILLPDTAQKKSQRGEVLAVGPGKVAENGNRIPLDLKVGDKVLFARYAGTDIEDNDEQFLLIAERDVLAVIEE